MRLKCINNFAFLFGLFFVGTSILFAQNPLPVYYGPYELAEADQFVGDWTRSDGTYRLKIVKDGEVLKALYFNPQAIHVENSELIEDEDGIRLKVVLRDTGYPGSTYVLQYRPKYRILHGSYTIPGQAPAEVYFTH